MPSRIRVKSSKLLFKSGKSIVNEADKADPVDREEVQTGYQLLMEKQEKGI